MPKPGSVPYKDATTSLHLTKARALSGTLPKDDIVVILWGMRNNRLTEAASLRKGQTITVALTPWEEVEEEYGGYNRAELEDPNVLALDTYWGELQ